MSNILLSTVQCMIILCFFDFWWDQKCLVAYFGLYIRFLWNPWHLLGIFCSKFSQTHDGEQQCEERIAKEIESYDRQNWRLEGGEEQPDVNRLGCHWGHADLPAQVVIEGEGYTLGPAAAGVCVDVCSPCNRQRPCQWLWSGQSHETMIMPKSCAQLARLQAEGSTQESGVYASLKQHSTVHRHRWFVTKAGEWESWPHLLPDGALGLVRWGSAAELALATLALESLQTDQVSDQPGPDT